MKKISILLFALVLGTINLFAQAPERISFQAEVRNSSNALVVSSPVKVRLSILQSSATGTAVYVETHNPTTSATGIISIQIGGGTGVSGSFTNINWASGPYFLRSEIDPANNTVPNYTTTATSQLLSVPYALYSKASGNAKILNGTTNPTAINGAAGDYYINTATNTLFGPRNATAWPPTATSLGRSLLNGTTTPANTLGNAGDYYLNTATNILIGPKTTTWPTIGLNLGGAAFLSGTTNPANTLGNAGDFYLNTTTNKLIGPKTATAWPTTKNPALFEHYVGELWGGGIVFNVWKDAAGVEHGLIATTTNQSVGTQVWSNVTSVTGGAISPFFDDGILGTSAIMGQLGHTTSAASLCDALVFGGFSDWYLPSYHELKVLSEKSFELNKILDGNTSFQRLYYVYYASSTDQPANPGTPSSVDANIFIEMISGNTLYNPKTAAGGCYVRAIRRF